MISDNIYRNSNKSNRHGVLSVPLTTNEKFVFERLQCDNNWSLYVAELT